MLFSSVFQVIATLKLKATNNFILIRFNYVAFEFNILKTLKHISVENLMLISSLVFRLYMESWIKRKEGEASAAFGLTCSQLHAH